MAHVHLPTVARSVTLLVRVTGARRLAWRLAAGALLLRLAALVMGVGLDVAVTEPGDRPAA